MGTNTARVGDIPAIKSGDPVRARDMEAIRSEVARLENLRVAAPLQISRTGAGVFISLAGGVGGGVAGKFYQTVKDADDEYPTRSNSTGIFPAVPVTISAFDDDISDSVAFTTPAIIDENNRVFVYNVAGLDNYIPFGSQFIGFSIGGELVCEFYNPNPEYVEGYLAGNLTSGNGATATLNTWETDEDGVWTATGDSVTIVNRGGFVASSGAYCMAAKFPEPLQVTGYGYRPVMIGCA